MLAHLKKNNFLALLLIVTVALFAAACGESEEDNQENGENQEVVTETLTIEIDTAGSQLTAAEGQDVIVAFIVENGGDAEVADTVELTLGSISESMEITVGANASASGSFTWTTAAGNAGTYTAQVSVGEASATASVTVSAPDDTNQQVGEAFFELALDEDESELEVTLGETVTVVVLVANTGDAAAVLDITGQITLESGASGPLQVEQQDGDINQPIPPLNGARLELQLATGTADTQIPAGAHTLTINSQHDSLVVNITVNPAD